MFKILHITRDFPPRTNGGISTAVGGMVEALVDRGHQCATISFDGWRPRATTGDSATVEISEDGSVCRLSCSQQVPAAREFGLGFAADIVHVHHGMLWQFGFDIAERLGCRTIFSVHVAQAVQNRLRGLTGVTHSVVAQRLALAQAESVVVPSRSTHRAMVEDGCEPDKLVYCPLGAVEPRVSSQERLPGSTVLYAGRFSDINGFRDLLEAIPIVVDAHKTARFVIAGGLPDNPKSERKWLRSIAASSAAAVIDVRGWQSAESLAELYSTASVLVVPSWYETFGLVALEGMLSGIAIAATRGGALDELLVHGETAHLCATRNPDSLAEGIVTLLKDPVLRERIGRSAKAEASAKWLWRLRVADLENHYCRLHKSRCSDSLA